MKFLTRIALIFSLAFSATAIAGTGKAIMAS